MKKGKIGFVLVGILLMGFSTIPIYGQLSIEDCQQRAKENYPLIKQHELISISESYSLSNVSSGWLPRITLSAKATYQSDVTGIPVKVPLVKIEEMNKDQYQAILEVSQVIYDGGEISKQKKITRASSEVDQKQLEVDLYAVNDRVNNLFFGILLLQEQMKQNKLLQEELQRNYDRASSYIQSGIANQSDQDAVKVNQLNTTQRQTELRSACDAYLNMLSVFVGEKLVEDDLQKPQTKEGLLSINRPELSLIDARINQLKVQEEIIDARNLPKLGAFVQGGYGNPGLNMLKNAFTTYYIAGMRFSWSLNGFYTRKNERQLLRTGKLRLENQKEIFLFNTGLQLTLQSNEQKKLQSLIVDDDEIIRLRENIRTSSEVKVQNGTLSVTDLLRDLTLEDQARQSRLLHEIQLLKTVYDIKYTTNN